jgi:hypothetical protein
MTDWTFSFFSFTSPQGRSRSNKGVRNFEEWSKSDGWLKVGEGNRLGRPPCLGLDGGDEGRGRGELTLFESITWEREREREGGWPGGNEVSPSLWLVLCSGRHGDGVPSHLPAQSTAALPVSPVPPIFLKTQPFLIKIDYPLLSIRNQYFDLILKNQNFRPTKLSER